MVSAIYIDVILEWVEFPEFVKFQFLQVLKLKTTSNALVSFKFVAIGGETLKKVYFESASYVFTMYVLTLFQNVLCSPSPPTYIGNYLTRVIRGLL